jgi:hypothetical protein
MQKLQEHLIEIRKEFHLRHGHEFGFTESQSEAHFDITTQAAMAYIQGLAMSGRMQEMQDMIKGGEDALRNSPYFEELIQKCADSYYALDWDADRKRQLSVAVLKFALQGLRERFISGGYSNDTEGVLKFLGLDSGMLGLMGKMSGMFNMFRKK